ncbi:MAG: TIGR03936 family radical SAM-associated protein [Elusimicrobiota bacterium]|nr:TIGR03936 family radical SAM-associated protein [Elusimicrobiota bacterium]
MESVQRVRIEYSKKGPIRYIGHLDSMHTFFRAFKRANLPVTYTQGFNPRIKCSFSPALPLGFASEVEYIELYLDKKIDISSSVEKLQKELPEGLTVHNMEKLPLLGKPSNVKIKAVAYRANLQQFCGKSAVSDPVTREDIEGKIRDFLDKEEILLMDKKGRRVNIRPLILSMEMGGDCNVRLLLKAGGEFNFNPRIIVKTLLGLEKEELAFVEFTREKFLFW